MSDNLSPYEAVQYEEGIRKTLPYYEAFFSETISLVKYLNPNVDTWLDTGCGTGALISRAHIVFPDTTYILADPSPEMLDKAMESLKEVPEDKLRIIGNVGTENIPAITPHRPQVITAILSHHYFQNEERYIATKKCHGLLEDGGLYITFENIKPLTEEGKQIGLGRWKTFQLLQGKTEDETNAHINRYGRSYFPITIEEHLSVLKESGFNVAEQFWFSNMQAGFYAIK
jgi:tRNA (cmo5U34)-methyltransferase